MQLQNSERQKLYWINCKGCYFLKKYKINNVEINTRFKYLGQDSSRFHIFLINLIQDYDDNSLSFWQMYMNICIIYLFKRERLQHIDIKKCVIFFLVNVY